jgi:hypothetical protein
VTIAVATVVTVSGPQGFDEHEDGTLVFATDLGVPLRWDVNARLHRATVQGTETTDTHLTATLKSDSFAKT